MSKLRLLALDAEGTVIDPLDGEFLKENPFGECIIDAIRIGLNDEDVAGLLVKTHRITPIHARRNVLEFRARLVRLGLVR